MNTFQRVTIGILFSIIVTMPILPAYGASTTPTVSPATSKSPTPPPANPKVDELKERLATKVAELRQVEQKAVSGTVKSISITSMIVGGIAKDFKIELTDDIKVAQIVKGKRTTLSNDDIAKDDYVTVFGEYDVTLDLLKAQAVFIEGVIPQHIQGTVSDIDRKNFTLTVASDNGKSAVIDIETYTKTQAWNSGTGLEKSGFSKLTVGNVVHIVGTPVEDEENRYHGQRILNLGNLTGAPTPQATATPTPVESEATTTPTKKPTPKSTPTISASPTQ